MAKKHKGSKGNQNLPEKSGFKGGASTADATVCERTGIDNGGGNGGNGVEKGFKGGASTADATVCERTGIDNGGGNGGNGVEKGFKGGATAADETVCEVTEVTGIDNGSGNGGKAALNPNTMLNKSGGGGGSGSGVVTRTVGKTLGMAKTVIMAAVLISVAGAGVDVYQTYNDAIEIDLEKHITDADFELSEDKSEISGSVGFDIPEMGMFEKSIIASVHVTILESNPTTDGDYEFEYTLGSGEHFYDFTLDDLDPVTVEKIEAGQPLDIEYSGTISVTYLGIEIPSVTMDIPLTTTTVETA